MGGAVRGSWGPGQQHSWMEGGLGLESLEAWVPAPAGRCGQKPEFLDSPFQPAGPPINLGRSIPVGEVRRGRR